MDLVVSAVEEGDDLGTVCGAYLYKTSFEGENETGYGKIFDYRPVCHPERRAKPEAEGSSNHSCTVRRIGAKILRLASLAQDDSGVGSVKIHNFRSLKSPNLSRNFC